MRLHGYCTRCHRIRRVSVRMPLTPMPHGVCDECAAPAPDPRRRPARVRRRTEG